MDDQVLNQNEVKSLLGQALETSPSEPQLKSAQAEPSPAQNWQDRQLEAVQARYQDICTELATELQSLLGTEAQVRVTSVRLATVGEFILAMESPTCLNVIDAKPLQSPWFLEIESGVMFPLIARLLGGGNQVMTPVTRAATEIELHLVRQITERFLEILQRAWSGALDCSFSLQHVENNPQRMKGLVSRDELMLVQMEISFDDVRGNWCQGLPVSALRSARAVLAPGVLEDAQPAESSLNLVEADSSAEGDQVELRALLAQMRITPADFAALAEGDVLRTPIEVDEGFKIYLGGEPKFKARAGIVNGYKAIEIQERLDSSGEEAETG